ncbi:lysM domain receptor-like kinase 3 isoform X1 [Arachis stenosperma]|uniref:lysM domain receptor-like kinase 3 isoform X1 n=1 Tax=Arachis stenosperma TaxID=217475 RepID=UPI0025AC41B6|nr:lysM domain receptor-like kinase 3 isoform X1 [Arachis stenosperma]
MASSLNNLLCLLFSLMATSSSIRVSAFRVSMKTTYMDPLSCSVEAANTCTASLYHITHDDYSLEEIAFYYSVNSSQIKPIKYGTRQDYLITVPCSCKNTQNLSGYFYHTTYKNVKHGDIFVDISASVYSGQAMLITQSLIPGEDLEIDIPCGCSEDEGQRVVTYTVQQNDTPETISLLLNATLPAFLRMNKILAQKPGFIDIGWVLFVPLELNGVHGVPPQPTQKTKRNWPMIVGIVVGVLLLSVIIITILIILWRRRVHQISRNDSTVVSKRSFVNRNITLHNSILYKEYMGDVMQIESERPVIYGLEEIEEATNNFDEARKIGVGGYGSVYFGILEQKEVAVKKMRSNKTKEFYAELKALCKIHHINIVELLGYARGEDHLYLVYEYVSNGSLSEHIHDPLEQGHQPLSWNARVQIALDAARGIEYIHDHTKARYVHRDIKTSNILVDEKLRAKVADFGLAMLVDRSNDENFIATRLVGTPGYLPPESVKELQVTPKTDVFAFGVVLAELITGKRALFRDNNEEGTKMKSLISLTFFLHQVHQIFQDAEAENGLEDVIDKNLEANYPIEYVLKVAEIAGRCLQEDPVERPEMRDLVGALSQIVMNSIEWEASLGGNSQVFSGVFTGR